MRERYLKQAALAGFTGTNSSVLQECPNRPIIFVGHCLGGLVMQQVSQVVKLRTKAY